MRERDTGWRDFLRRMRDVARGPYAKVGVLDNGGPGSASSDGSDMTLAQLAVIHEFGTEDGRIPERSFIRSTFDEKRDEYAALARRMIPMIFDGRMDPQRAVGLLGAKMAADVKGKVTKGAGVPPPNAPSTLKAKEAKRRPGSKGQPRPLVDTGRMIGAVTWKVEEGGS